MSRPSRPANRLAAALPLALLALLAPRATAAAAGQILVVWISHPVDPAPETCRAAIRRLDEAGITIVADPSPVVPERSRVLETLAVYRAAAVIWHEADGALGVQLRGGGEPASLRFQSGSADEEALYIRELLVARLLGENPSVDLLITAPEEVVPSPAPRQLSVTRPRSEIREAADEAERLSRGPRLALGWRWRAHFDEAAWSQHGVSAHLPAWRFESGLELRLTGGIGLPVRIGEPGVTWLELTDLELGFEAGVRPVRGRFADVELFTGAGAYHLRAAAFLPDGTARSADHLAAQVTAGVAVAWRLSDRLEVRLRGGTHRVIGPGWFSINGHGDFGAEPWQPFAGLDLSVALPGGP
jgi:hypothetical protein